MGVNIILRSTATTKNGSKTADLMKRVKKLYFAKNFQSLLVSLNLCVFVRCHTIPIANIDLNLQCLQHTDSNVSLKILHITIIILHLPPFHHLPIHKEHHPRVLCSGKCNNYYLHLSNSNYS